MRGRTETWIGAAAGAVALAAILVFGIKALVELHDRSAGDDRPRGQVVARLAEVVDPDYAIRLAAPDATWEVFGPDEADRFFSGAIAMMTSAGGVLVIVPERIGDVALAAAVAELDIGAAPALTPVTWLGRDALEVRVTDDAGNETMRERVFLRDGIRFAVIVIPALGGDVAELPLDTLWGAVALEPHPPRPRTLASSVAPAGAHWRVRGGRWRSALYGAELVAPSGWRLAPPKAFSSVTDLAVENAACDCALLFATNAALDAPAADARARDLDILGVRTTLRQSRDPKRSITVWNGVFTTGGVEVAVRFWHATAFEDLAFSELARVLAGFVPLATGQRAALASEIARHPYQPTAFGDGWAVRGGVFADYARGLTWTAPPGAWEIQASDAALTAHGDAGALAFQIMADDEIDQPGHRDPYGADWDEPARPAPAIPGSPLTDRLERTAGGMVMTEAVLRTPEHAFRVEWRAPAERPEAARPLVDGLAARPVAPIDDGAEVIDRRWGYRVTGPTRARPNFAESEEGAVRLWSTPSGFAGVAVLWPPDAASSRATQTRIRRLASAAVKRGRAERPHERATTLDGVPAIEQSWREGRQTVTVILADHLGLTYAVVASDAALAERVRAALHFVDRPDGA